MRILIVEELHFQNKFAVKIDADLGSFSDMSFILLTLKIIFSIDKGEKMMYNIVLH